jgi:PAS domain S-box-containing protein
MNPDKQSIRRWQSATAHAAPAFPDRAFRPPIQHLLTISGTVFVADIVAMFVMKRLALDSLLVKSLLDAFLVTAIAYPVIYLFVSHSSTLARQVVKRQHTEFALRQSETRYRSLFETSRDALMTSDPSSLGFTSANLAALEMFGANNEEEFVSYGPQDLSPERQPDGRNSAEKAKELMEIAVREGSHFFEWTHRRIGGVDFPTDVLLTKMEVDGKVALQATVRDLTERKLVEEQMRLQSAALKAAANAIIITDSRGIIKWVNPAFTTLTGYSSEEVIGKTPRILKSGKQDSSFYHELWKTITEGRVWHGELINRRKDGSLYADEMTITPVRDDNGNVLQFIAIKQEVTQQRAAEAALRIRDRAFDTSVSALATSDLAGNLTYVNAAYVKMFGYANATEILGKPFASLFVDAAAVESAVRTLHEQGQWTGELIARRTDGTSMDVLISSSVATDTAGQPLSIVASLFDITERTRAEEALHESNRCLQNALSDLKAAEGQVIQQERLRALGTMASGIAHDFNNSLTAILGGSELLLSRPGSLDDKEKVRSYIEMMNTAAQDAGKVVDRLREFYRHREKGEVFVSVNINELVGQAVALTQPKWKAEAEVQGVSVKVHTELQEVPPISGNAAELREVLTNLIFNAVDAMPRGGTITIHTRREDGHVVLEIDDTGTGMSEEVRRRCLEPFFTTKGTRGTGLGLSLVYGVLQRHQGTVDIKTEVGKGTTFLIRLPVQSAQPQSEPKAQPLDAAQHLHVLVVDDEAVVRRIVGEYLKLDGHIVEAANSGLEGLEKFRNTRFDLVLLDRAMPGMNGDQVAATIKSTNPAVPIIMLTGFGGMMEAADEKPVGVDLILGKPVTISALRTALSKAVASVN